MDRVERPMSDPLSMPPANLSAIALRKNSWLGSTKMLQIINGMKALLSILTMVSCLTLSGQQYLTRQGLLTFDAGSPLEDIRATSNSATAVYDDAKDGKLGVQVLMTSFEFRRALMQEHFNENYVESEVYPKAVFKGAFKDGRAIGTLDIHGVSRDVNVPATLVKDDDAVRLKASFAVTIEDFGVAIPSAVANKIDPQAKITVDCTLQAR